MAAIDYFGIAEELAEIIRASFPDIMVLVEEEAIIGPDTSPIIAVYVDRRTVPPNQPIAAGLKMRVQPRLSVWVWTAGLVSRDTIKQRDDYVGKVELLLLSNRTLNGKVDMLWVDGGELPTVKLPEASGFTSGGEIIVRAEVTAEF